MNLRIPASPPPAFQREMEICMFKWFTQGVLVVLSAFLLLNAPVPATAEAPMAATAASTAERLSFAAGDGHDGLRLTLGVPDGRVFQYLDEEASRVTVDLADPEGRPLPDGLYVYELWQGEGDRETFLRSGFFSVRDGSLVAETEEESGGAAVEGSAIGSRSAASSISYIAAEQTISDDLFVQGNLCLGFDCFGNEAFGLFNLIMKENNNRMLFDDTSSSGSFPRNDWALVLNERFNGGAGKFSIQDCGTSGAGCSERGAIEPFTILAGAGDNAIFVGSSGRVGFGTSVPARQLHARDGDTPALRLEQDGSEGFATQTWDVGGNEVNFFIADVTSGFRLPLRVQAGAPSNSLFIDSIGDVGLGTNAPAARLDVVGSIAVSGTVDGRDVSADGALLDSHVADLANPHQVTAAQAGADPAGTAASVLAAHEAAFDHQDIPSALPVPVAEGGTGATDAATARANLGIVEIRSGNLPASAFAGAPAATAAVVFDQPYPAGTDYVVLLTAVTGDAKQTATPNVVAKDETGFTVTLGGPVRDLVEVGWLAREVAP